MESFYSKRNKPDGLFLISSIYFIAMFLVARLMLKEFDLPIFAKIMITVVAILSFVFFIVQFIQGIKKLDELQRRIQLEALAFAFPLTMIMLMSLGMFQLFIELPVEDFSYRHVWAFLPAFYFAGLAIARKRYL